MSQVHQCIRHCLWQLDSGMLDNACRAIRETVQLPDHYAAAVILESRRQFPATSERNGEQAGSKEQVRGDVRLEDQITETIRQREKSRSPLKLLPADAAKQLEAEINDLNNLWTPDVFETLCRIYLAVRKTAREPLADTRLIAPKNNSPGKEIRLARLIELLDLCRFDREGQAEEQLRTELYDESGQERLETTELFQKLPYLRALVQNSVNQSKLRDASLRSLRIPTIFAAIATIILAIALGLFFNAWDQRQDDWIESHNDRIEGLANRMHFLDKAIGVDSSKQTSGAAPEETKKP